MRSVLGRWDGVGTEDGARECGRSLSVLGEW